MTSHDVVARVRRKVDTRRVGHAGTLDPMATGLLVLGVNGATRLLTYLVGLDKEYLATIRLGASTSTDDADGTMSSVAAPELLASIDDAGIHAGIGMLTGRIGQVPSAVSAIKVDGRRAHERVRAGEDVKLAAREVTVSAFDVLEIRRAAFVDVDVRVECSSGTYVRALARDLGAALGVGGHVTSLRRTRVGPFSIGSATMIDDIDAARDLRTPADIARALFPVLELSHEQAIDLGHGKKLALDDSPVAARKGPVAAIAPDGRLVGLVSVTATTAEVLFNLPAEGSEA
ncbi:MAG: tRNA pseudouridine(55) synthase TruB [Cryobacterium sp.]|nr:tRNA pseudouridine(55) synthase TruB [Cryobacterium sp.]